MYTKIAALAKLGLPGFAYIYSVINTISSRLPGTECNYLIRLEITVGKGFAADPRAVVLY